MSWRIIFAIVIVALGASAWGGIRLGEWLVEYGPVKPEVKATPPELSDVAILDADGRPFVAAAPQPLVDGRLGVPELEGPIDWELEAPSVAQTQTETPIGLATTTISMDEAIRIANANPHGLKGLADVGDLMGAGNQNSGAPNQGGQFIQPVDITTPPPPPPPVASGPGAGGNWEAALSKELQQCSQLGFFDRPSCSWAARNKYCEPNNAWGRTRDCPARSF